MERLRIRPEDERAETKLTDEAREALQAMIKEGTVDFAFEGRHPDTRQRNRFIGVKAHRKLFSKGTWKIRILFGNGEQQRWEMTAPDAEVEKSIWKALELIDEDFLRLQRGEAILDRRRNG